MSKPATYYSRHREHIRSKAKHRRRSDVAWAILADSRKADRKKGHSNDLDLEFVGHAISQPCSYCGETSLRMTLDRVDNAVGHTRDNVVPSCERCNFARRDMPYSAWLCVSVAMRQAREEGLFGDWVGGIHRRATLDALVGAPYRVAPAHGTIARYQKCGPPTCEDCRRAMREWKRARRNMQRT